MDPLGSPLDQPRMQHMNHITLRPLPSLPVDRAACEPQGRRTPSCAAEWQEELPNRWYARRGRRLFDLALLIALLPPSLVVMAAVAVCNLIVFKNPREVFFTQPRMGWRNRPFQIFKFRTMREAQGSELSSWSSGADRLRVTRLGRFLRNTHLDELPQLFNILKGDMSFIGPRPEMIEIEAWAAAEVPGFTNRLALRPGITGLAQITQGYTGRDAEAYAEKLELNADYMRRVSFALDVSIVLRTVLWMARGKGWSWNVPRPANKQSSVEAGRASNPGKRALGRERRRAS